MADILGHMHYGICIQIAFNEDGHISTNVQRQKLSIAASESARCNASPQRATIGPHEGTGRHKQTPKFNSTYKQLSNAHERRSGLGMSENWFPLRPDL